MTPAEIRTLELYGILWNAANKAGNPAGMDAAHAAAEALRASKGYSGGSDGSGYIPTKTGTPSGGAKTTTGNGIKQVGFAAEAGGGGAYVPWDAVWAALFDTAPAVTGGALVGVPIPDSTILHWERELSRIQQGLSGVAGKYGNLECVEAAAALQAYLTKLKKNGELLILTFPDSGFVISYSHGVNEAISHNGMHQGVKYNGLVYCNIHPKGLPEAAWIADFVVANFRVPIVTRIPF